MLTRRIWRESKFNRRMHRQIVEHLGHAATSQLTVARVDCGWDRAEQLTRHVAPAASTQATC